MSDMTSLSHEYAASADFAQELNTAVLQLKKALLPASEVQAPNDSALREARAEIAAILLGLLKRLGAAERITSAEREKSIPEDVVRRVEAKQQPRLTYFVDDLKRAAASLASEGALDSEVLSVLDEICDAADACASASFRRLRRR